MKHLIPVPIENKTGFKPSMGKVKALKKENYFIVKDYAITGDAPKEFIKAYVHG